LIVTLTESTLSILPANAPVTIEKTAGAVRIHVPAGCQASLTENYASQGDNVYTTQAKIDITLEASARLTHYKLVQEGPQAVHQSFIEAHVHKSAAFISHAFLFGGASIRNTIHVRLDGEGAECSLNGLYLGTARQIIETHTLIEHLEPHGTSKEFYKGILDEQAQGLFDGLIVVQKKAQKTDSTQTNKNLLLSPKAKAHSNPELKILANDVKCKHGSTIGQLSVEQMFYLRSRGIPEGEARKLLIYAFASEMIERIETPEMKEQLSAALFTKFHATL
jgi:Fe-S cluster assembly protein SufD